MKDKKKTAQAVVQIRYPGERESRARELGHAWAEDSGHRKELNRFSKRFTTYPPEDWDFLLEELIPGQAFPAIAEINHL